MTELSQDGGFNSGFWSTFWKPMVLDYGFHPTNTLVNIDLDKADSPSALSPEKIKHFKDFVDASKSAGLGMLAPLFAPNDSGGLGARGDSITLSIMHPWIDPWWDPVRELIIYGKGLALDSPSAYFLHGLLSAKQISAYQKFDIDAIHWAQKQGLTSVMVISPFFDSGHFAESTSEAFDILKAAAALPTTWVVENYNECGNPYPNPCTSSDAAYRTPVGNEEQKETVAGVALTLAIRLTK